jgi:hypothetical protein
MSIGGFFTTYLASAQQSAAQTGWLVSVTLAQWADETNYGATLGGPDVWNFAGVTDPSTGNLFSYPSEQAGLASYVQTANLSYYTAVKAAAGSGAEAEATALGKSPWAGGHYDSNNTGHPGVDLIDIINSNNLTQYDAGGGATGASGAAAGIAPVATLIPIPIPPAGMDSDISTGSFFINGKTMDVDVTAALVNVAIDLDITQASTLVLTMEDPSRTIINNPVFAQASTVSILPDLFMWQMVALDKATNVVTATFEPYVVAALRSAPTQVPFSVNPGQMTRSDFATLLINQVQATASVAPAAYIATLPTTNGQPAGITQEQLSRGTTTNIYEDSWTCLQRLASEVQWVCFCYDTTVYFGPQEWLAQLPVALTIQEFQNGILTIDGTFDTGQPLGTLTVHALAGSWTPAPGQSVAVNNLGPFSQAASFVYKLNPDQPATIGQNWITATVSRASVFQPDIIITLQQALPSLPEPATGGATAAVAPGLAAGAIGPQPSAATANIFWPVPPPGTDGAPTQNRVDQGVDWGQGGGVTYPIYAVANGTITNLTNSGWPGGAFITLALSNAPDTTHTMVYYSEYITPSVTVGQVVKGGDVIGKANGGSGSDGSGIEVGWADPSAIGQSLNTKLNGQYSGTGPTPEGQSFLAWITSGGTPT